MSTVIGVSIFELHIPHARSLKQKRRVVKSLIARIHNRYRVSIVESDFHDLHQRTEISLAFVARTSSEVDRALDRIHDLISSEIEAELLDWQPEILSTWS